MLEVGRVTAVWRYPVKSMAGEQLESAHFGGLGLHADRTWAVRDREHDATSSAKRLPGLLWCTARYAQTPPPEAGPGCAPEVIIGFPDGQELSSSDPAIDATLSGFLDRDVELRPLPPIDDRGQYRGSRATQADLRVIFGLGADEPLPDLSMFPLRKLAEITRYATPVGSYVDAYPVHLLSEQSLQAMAALAPGSNFDPRRFRPSILIDSPGDAAQPELDWCGGVLHGPHAALAPLIPTIRCVMPTHDQPELVRDIEIVRTIAAHARRCLGVYGTVSKAGRVSAGDILRFAPPNRPVASAESTTGKLKRAALRAVAATLPRR